MIMKILKIRRLLTSLFDLLILKGDGNSKVMDVVVGREMVGGAILEDVIVSIGEGEGGSVSTEEMTSEQELKPNKRELIRLGVN